MCPDEDIVAPSAIRFQQDSGADWARATGYEAALAPYGMELVDLNQSEGVAVKVSGGVVGTYLMGLNPERTPYLERVNEWRARRGQDPIPGPELRIAGSAD